MSPILALTLTASLAAPASAPPPSPVPLIVQASRLAVETTPPGPEHATRAAARGALPPGGDSLRNGATIGAVMGGVALGGFVGYLCYMLDETEGHGDCVKAALLWGGIGAAGGAALGAGVDALFDRPMAVVRVRF